MIDTSKIRAVVAPTSDGPLVALWGGNKATRAALADRFGKPTAGGFWIVTPQAAWELVHGA